VAGAAPPLSPALHAHPRLLAEPGRTIWFAPITERAIRRSSFKSVRELRQQIEQFVRCHNANATPFTWVATADSILKKIERLATRTSATEH